MKEMTVSEIADAVGGQLQGANKGSLVAGPAVIDSRQVTPGTLFVAFAGEHVDGADFAPAAAQAGAAAVLADRPIPNLSVPLIIVDDVQTALGDLARHSLAGVRQVNPDLRILAVTGSQGKTTTKDILSQLVSPGADGYGGTTIAPPGSFNNEIGLPLTVLKISPDTKYAVLEMGADHPGNIADLTNIAPPNVGGVLTVGTAHLETFGSRDGIAKAKSEMIDGVVAGGAAILNLDDSRVAAMQDKAAGRGLNTVLFGRSEGADVQANDVVLDPLGRAGFTLRVKGSALEASENANDLQYPVQLQIPGEHHVSNALAAASGAILVGIPPQAVAQRLSEVKILSPHRMAFTTRPDGIMVIDDAYNANPESMSAALRTLAKVAASPGHGRSVAIIGEMRELGETGGDAHGDMGQLAADLGLDQLYVVGAGARAAFDHAQQAAQPAGAWAGQASYFASLDDLRAGLPGLLQPGDVVLVKASNGSKLWQLGDELARGDYSPVASVNAVEASAASAASAATSATEKAMAS